MRIKCLICFFSLLLLPGCGSGYRKTDGKWTYVVISTANGREVHDMDVDEGTFRVLKPGDYAVDKDHVYKGIMVLDGVDPSSYEQFDGTEYAKDKNNAYFDDAIIVGADPATFKVIDYPYARDAIAIYIGCLRMNVESPDDFRVFKDTDTARSVAYLRSTSEVVNHYGDEFNDCRVLYDERKRDERFVVKVPDRGQATDGKWTYLGPRRCAMAK